jgi:RNA polymerase sigma-70 factor (ECF subfamily)
MGIARADRISPSDRQPAIEVPSGLDGAPAGDEALALAARTDRGAFAELYVRHRQPVFGYLRARSVSDDDALELTAVTFERALQAIHRYSTQRGGVRAWLLRIARNAAIDQARRGSWLSAAPAGKERLDRASGDPSPEDLAIAADERSRIRRSLAELADAERDAIGLRFGAGLTAREIGLVLGKREAATQKLIERALARLKEVHRDRA